MAADVLNYTGNAALAAGSGADNGITDIGTSDLSPALGALKSLADRKNQVADQEYQQKIKDRDTTFSMVAKLQADFDKALPEAREQLKSRIDSITQKLISNPDILSNPAAYKEVVQETNDFNELNAYAKTNYKTITEDIAAASKITDPRARQAYLDHIKEQREVIKNDPYALYDPKKPEIVWNLPDMMKDASDDTSVTRYGGVYKKTDTFSKVNEMLDHYRTTVIDGMDKTVQDQWKAWDADFLSHLKQAKPDTNIATFKAWNDNIDKANKRLPENQQLKHIQYDNNGQPIIDNIDDFNQAAYVGLKYKEKLGVTEFDNDAKSIAEVKDKNAASRLKDAQAYKAYKDADSETKLRAAQAEHFREQAKNEHEKREAFDSSFIGETEGAFSRIFNSARKAGKDLFDIHPNILGASDRIGLGLSPEDKVKKILYDSKAGVYRVIKEKMGAPLLDADGKVKKKAEVSTEQINIEPAAFYRNLVSDYYSTKMKMTDPTGEGRVDPAKLEYQISQALQKGLRNSRYKDANELNYITGGMKDARVYPVTSPSGKQYIEIAGQHYRYNETTGEREPVSEDEVNETGKFAPKHTVKKRK